MLGVGREVGRLVSDVSLSVPPGLIQPQVIYCLRSVTGMALTQCEADHKLGKMVPYLNRVSMEFSKWNCDLYSMIIKRINH